jgi:hypothetical protein
MIRNMIGIMIRINLFWVFSGVFCFSADARDMGGDDVWSEKDSSLHTKTMMT